MKLKELSQLISKFGKVNTENKLFTLKLKATRN